MHFTTIDPEACKRADIANNDGRLECSSNFFKDMPPKMQDLFLLCATAVEGIILHAMALPIGGAKYTLAIFIFMGLPTAILDAVAKVDDIEQLFKFFEERPIIAGLYLLFDAAIRSMIFSAILYVIAAVIVIFVGLPLIVFRKIYYYLKVIAILTALPYAAPAAPAA